MTTYYINRKREGIIKTVDECFTRLSALDSLFLFSASDIFSIYFISSMKVD